MDEINSEKFNPVLRLKAPDFHLNYHKVTFACFSLTKRKLGVILSILFVISVAT